MPAKKDKGNEKEAKKTVHLAAPTPLLFGFNENDDDDGQSTVNILGQQDLPPASKHMGLAAILAENGNVEAAADVINHMASVPSRRRAAAHVNTGVSRRVSSTHGHPSSF